METIKHGLLSPAINKGNGVFYNYFIVGTCGHNRYFQTALAYDTAMRALKLGEGLCIKCARARLKMEAAFLDADYNL